MVSVFLALVAYLLLIRMQASLNQAQDAVQQMQSLRDDVLRLQADIHTAKEALQTSEVTIYLNIFDVHEMLRMFSGLSQYWMFAVPHCLRCLALVMPTEH